MKTLLESSTNATPIEACLFEAEDDIGGTFRYRAYDNAELVSSKQLTAFSDYRFPTEQHDHVSLPQYVAYLQSYVDRFHLAKHIKLGHRVVDISPIVQDGRRHRLIYSDKNGNEGTFECSHIAMCTGLHVEPAIPSIPGIENINGEVFHSSQYRHRSQLAGRDVLILGCGETAMGMFYLPSPYSDTDRVVQISHMNP